MSAFRSVATLLLLLLFSSFAHPQDQVSPSLTPQQLEAKEKAINAIMQELDDLIPGEFSKAPEKEKAAREIIVNFVDGKGGKAMELIQAQADSDPTFPPKELVIAALQITANNGASAMQNLETVARENPEYPGGFIAFARLALTQNRIADAHSHLQRVRRLIDGKSWSDDEKKHFELGYLDSLADVKLRYEQWDDALVSLEQIDRMLPNNPKTLIRKAEVAFRKENPEKSLALLERFATHAPEDSEVRKSELMLASWYNNIGNIGEAEKYVNLASEKYPEDIAVLSEVAEWMVARENYPAAQIAIRRIEDDKGETFASKFLKGKIAFAQSAYGLAEAHFSELAAKAPTNFDLINHWALSLIESKNAEKQKLALQLAEQNMRLQPKNVVALGVLGWIHYRLGDKRQAQMALGRATQVGFSSPEVSYFVAVMLNDQGNKQPAKDLIKKALEYDGAFLFRQAAMDLAETLEGELNQLPSPDGQ